MLASVSNIDNGGATLCIRPLNEMLQKISVDAMETQYTTLAHEFENWRGDLEQVDDVLVIGIRL